MFAGKLSRTLFPHALAPLVLHAAQTAAQSAFAVRRVKSQAKSEVDNPAAFFHETRSAANLAKKVHWQACMPSCCHRLLTCMADGTHVSDNNENGTCLFANLLGRIFELLLQHCPCCA